MSDLRDQLEGSLALQEKRRLQQAMQQDAAQTNRQWDEPFTPTPSLADGIVAQVGVVNPWKPEPTPEVSLTFSGLVKHSPTIGKIGGALAKAQGQITGAAKDSTNPHFQSHYADLASVADACRAALSSNEIAVVQSPSADGNLIRMVTLLLHSSGEWIESEPLQVQARDAAPQSVGSCLTYLRRYQLAAMAGVAPHDDDAEAATKHQSAPREPRAERKVTPQSAPNDAPNTTGIIKPKRPITPAEEAALPSGAVYIFEVAPAFAPAKANLALSTGEHLPLFRSDYRTIAERACREVLPVFITAKVSNNSKKPYLSNIAIVNLGEPKVTDSEFDQRVDEREQPF